MPEFTPDILPQKFEFYVPGIPEKILVMELNGDRSLGKCFERDDPTKHSGWSWKPSEICSSLNRVNSWVLLDIILGCNCAYCNNLREDQNDYICGACRNKLYD